MSLRWRDGEGGKGGQFGGAVAPDGALWLSDDAASGGLFRITPK